MNRFLKVFPLLALAFACAAFSQDNPPQAQCAGGDSMHQMMPGHEGRAMGEWHGERHGMMGAWQGMQGMREGRMAFQQNFRQHRMFHRGLFLVFFLVFVLVNILLTILVCMDMAALGRFNALWVPVLLLCGIAGTALYALFRIGDQIRAAAGPKA
jgi:hypothetical protein